MSTAIYTRLSRDTKKGTSDEGLAVARQEKACRALAKRRGWNDIVVFEDNDRSASNRKPRPGYIALGEAITSGDVQRLVVWHPDRLIRDTRHDLEPFIAVAEQAGLEIDAVQSGNYDLTTPGGRMVARMLAAAARGEMELKSERTKAKLAEQAQAGKTPGGNRSYGWSKKEKDTIPSIIDSEAAVIREAAERVIAGEPLRAITSDFNARRIPTASGGQWWGQVLRKVLIHPKLAGLRSYHGEIVADGEWQPILDRATYDHVVAILTDPNRVKTRKGNRYPLSGLIEDHRGYVMGGSPDGEGRRYRTNVPSGVSNTQIGAATVETVVYESILKLTDSKSLPLVEGSSTDIETVKRLQVELDELAALKGSGSISTAEWLAAREPLAERLKAAEGNVRAVRAVPEWLRDLDKPGALRRVWDNLDAGQRRRVVQLFVERVVINPTDGKGRMGNPAARVSIVWKG